MGTAEEEEPKEEGDSPKDCDREEYHTAYVDDPAAACTENPPVEQYAAGFDEAQCCRLCHHNRPVYLDVVRCRKGRSIADYDDNLSGHRLLVAGSHESHVRARNGRRIAQRVQCSPYQSLSAIEFSKGSSAHARPYVPARTAAAIPHTRNLNSHQSMFRCPINWSACHKRRQDQPVIPAQFGSLSPSGQEACGNNCSTHRRQYCAGGV